MSRYFTDLTMYMECLNISLIVSLRRIRLEREGWFTDYINWEHYTKVLEAKQKLVNSNQ
jgi:hypothetical protein